MTLPALDAAIPTTKHGFQEDLDVHPTAKRRSPEFHYPTRRKGVQEAADIYNKIEVDNNMPPELPYELEFLPVEKPNFLVGKESPQKEKQISVDPISLKGSSMRKSSFKVMLSPIIIAQKAIAMNFPPTLPPAKPKFLSYSLPNSANSSPRFSLTQLKKKLRNESQASPRPVSNLARQHSVADDHLTLQQEVGLQRSKSCGAGRARASSDDFELWLAKPNAIEYDNVHYGSLSKIEAIEESHKVNVRNMDAVEENFKCNALCLFLPGFGRGKPVRARKEEAEINVISRTVSLEKFECASWASSAITHDNEDDSKQLYFDLPLELIRNSVNDAHSPVTAAFVFDNDRKGVLKNSSSRTTTRKSDESPRHVRFSTSSPMSYPASPASCITPRLRKAREEFNAFLEAQGA